MDSQATVVIAPVPNLGGKWLTALLPASKRCNSRQRWLLGIGLTGQLVTLLLTLAHAIFGIGGVTWENAIHGSVVAVYFSVSAAIVTIRAVTERRNRALWATAAASLWFYALAMALWVFWIGKGKNPPFPSICDVIWWISYALAGVTIIGAGGRLARPGGTLKIWLDGLIASTATAAIAAAFVLSPVVNSARGAHERRPG